MPRKKAETKAVATKKKAGRKPASIADMLEKAGIKDVQRLLVEPLGSLGQVLAVSGSLLIVQDNGSSELFFIRSKGAPFKAVMKVATQAFNALREWADKKGYWIIMV